MSIYDSGNKWKNAARGALASAKALEEQQRDVEFQRSLLSNIRQNRLARAQIELSSAGGDYTSSSAAGAIGSIDSSLAGEMKYSYETSQRAEDIQDYQQKAKEYMQKYAKQQKTRSMAYAVTGAIGAVVLAPLAATALAGAGSAAASAGMAGVGKALTAAGTAIKAASTTTLMSIGQSVGQIAAGSSGREKGISGLLSGLGNIHSEYKDYIRDPNNQTKIVAESLDSSGKPMVSSQQTYLQAPNGQLTPLTGGVYR